MDRVLDRRYRIVEPIGVGGTSSVYRAFDEVQKRDVAVKVLDPQAASDGQLRKLFTREAQALAKLSDPHIVAVYDVGEVDGLPYIVMEHLPGLSLRQRIERDGPLGVADAVGLATEIAGGLAFAHSRGIVHADLKPSNVLLTEDGHAKVADFGIARTPADDASTPQLFATAMYVAPERVEGKPVTAASDIYGLGLVMYEMLVGRPPFTSSNPAVLLRDHVVRQPVPPSHLRASLPKELDPIVLRCLAKEPSLRFARASDVARALAGLENVGSALATTRLVNEPLQDIRPRIDESPVVALLQAYGTPIRRAFFSALAAAPAFALLSLAGLGTLAALAVAGLVAALGLAGQLGFAMALGWVAETMCIFLFAPGLALLFALMGLFVWLRDVPAERAAMAMAMPVAAPLGLAPALMLSAAAIQGLGGVIAVGWGAVLTLIFAIGAGKQSFGPFVQTGMALEPGSLFDTPHAIAAKDAFLYALRPGVDDRLVQLRQSLDPGALVAQVATFVSRLVTADTAAIASILAWVVAALVVWTVTRLLRALFDAIAPRRAFALYVFATGAGVVSGAAVLYMTFIASLPLAESAGRPAAEVLFLAAFVGAVVALAVGVVVSATETPPTDEDLVPFTPPSVPVAGRR